MRPERSLGRVTAAAVAVAALALAPGAASAATITVTTTQDTLANDGQCSLREALSAAATDTASGPAAGECAAGSGPDTIVLGPNRYAISRPGIDDTNQAGDLDVVGGTVTIAGAGPATTIDGGGIDRAIDVLLGGNLTLQNLTITGGKVATSANGFNAGPGGNGGAGGPGGDSKGGAGVAGGGGGGVRSAGTLTLNGVTVTGNRAGDGGTGGTGAIAGAGGNGGAGQNGGNGGESDGGNGGDGGSGGGVLNAGGTATIIASTFTNNVAGNGGKGGAGADGGFGGTGGAGKNGGTGGPCRGGFGGSGGNGGGVATAPVGTTAPAGTTTISASDIEHNTSGVGGDGNGCGHGGQGGTGGTGAGGNGGMGGFGFAGFGGQAGHGGGVSDIAGSLTLSNSTVAVNTTSAGGAGSSVATGGAAGLAGGGGSGSGGFQSSGFGGGGGFGGGIGVLSSNAGEAMVSLAGDTVAGNQSGAGGNGGDGGTAGAGNTSHGGQGGQGGQGGGIEVDADFTITNLTVTGNRAGNGGAGGAGGTGPAGSNGGSGSLGGFGGGINVRGGGSIAHLTAVGNVGGLGGAGGAAGTGATHTAGSPGQNSIGDDLSLFLGEAAESASIVGSCGGTPTDGGGNVAGTTTGPTACLGIAGPLGLGPLAGNGGPTQTMALSPGSAAVDLIKPPCGTAPDQRGVPRPQGAGCDAGAYELAPPGVATGPASAIAENGATVAGQVNPNARATSWHIQFGTTTAYGGQTAPVSLAAGFAPAAVSARLTGLRPHTVIHYRLVASSPDGTSFGADATFTTAAFGGVQIVRRGLTASASGDVPVVLSCPSGALRSCTGTLTMTARVKVKIRAAADARAKPKRKTRTKTVTVTLGRTSFTVAAGARKTVHLHLNARSRGLLRAAGRSGLKVTLSATAKDAGGISIKTSLSTTLKRARS